MRYHIVVRVGGRKVLDIVIDDAEPEVEVRVQGAAGGQGEAAAFESGEKTEWRVLGGSERAPPEPVAGEELEQGVGASAQGTPAGAGRAGSEAAADSGESDVKRALESVVESGGEDEDTGRAPAEAEASPLPESPRQRAAGSRAGARRGGRGRSREEELYRKMADLLS